MTEGECVCRETACLHVMRVLWYVVDTTSACSRPDGLRLHLSTPAVAHGTRMSKTRGTPVWRSSFLLVSGRELGLCDIQHTAGHLIWAIFFLNCHVCIRRVEALKLKDWLLLYTSIYQVTLHPWSLLEGAGWEIYHHTCVCTGRSNVMQAGAMRVCLCIVV